MKCPVCKTVDLNPITLEKHLAAHTCKHCEGNWISSEDYWQWLDQHGTSLAEKPPEVFFDIEDTEKAKLCPNCQRILVKYKVGHGVNFFIDQCGHCNGIWLDKHEWDALKTRNLHDEIHHFFTQQWQKEVRKSEMKRNLSQLYEQKFGKADYAEVKRIRSWLENHPQRLALLAFINDEDPYQL
ncbi:MAG: zf-TFIIB domain-containing protein [Chroococcales cyanobacterium]